MEGTRDAGVAGRLPGDAEKQDRARTGERKFVVRLGHGRGIAGAKSGGVAPCADCGGTDAGSAPFPLRPAPPDRFGLR